MEIGISSAGQIMPPNVAANTLLLPTPDFQLPLLSPCVLPGERQHRQGPSVDDAETLASWSAALRLAVSLRATAPSLLPPEVLFILSLHCRDVPDFST